MDGKRGQSMSARSTMDRFPIEGNGKNADLWSYETRIRYTTINNAEFAPEISNEFVTIYMDED